MDASASGKIVGATGAAVGTACLLLMQLTAQDPAAGAGSLAVPHHWGRGAGAQTAEWTGGLLLLMLSLRAASTGLVGRRMRGQPGGTGTAGSGGLRRTEAASVRKTSGSVRTGETTAGVVLDASGRTGTGRSSRCVGAGLTGGSLIAQAAGGGTRRRRTGAGPGPGAGLVGQAAAAAAVGGPAAVTAVVGGAGRCR